MGFVRSMLPGLLWRQGYLKELLQALFFHDSLSVGKHFSFRKNIDLFQKLNQSNDEAENLQNH